MTTQGVGHHLLQKQGKSLHDSMLADCFRVMNKHLRENICNLESPGATVTVIDAGSRDDRLSAELRYACQSWLLHVQQAKTLVCDDDQTHNFLRHHLLHWLEAISLMGKTAEAIDGLEHLQFMLKVRFLCLQHRSLFGG